MRAETTRSGLVESVHHTRAIALDASGRVLSGWGDADRPLYYRSAVKPFQATVALEAGASLSVEQLAVASSSHSGAPAHLALVRSILAGAGLDERALQTPPSWPLGDLAAARVQRSGRHAPERIFHNCSGKHAGWLAACAAVGWPTGSYLDPAHPLQESIAAAIADCTGIDPRPVGVDGCGAPTLRGSIRGLALAFAALSEEPRYRAARTAMCRFPGLVGGNERPEGRIAAWFGGPVKGGAEGLLAAGRVGVGIAVKSDSGSHWVAAMGMMEVMRRLGMLSPAALEALEDVAHPPVLGGGRRAGRVEFTG